MAEDEIYGEICARIGKNPVSSSKVKTKVVGHRDAVGGKPGRGVDASKLARQLSQVDTPVKVHEGRADNTYAEAISVAGKRV